MMRLFTLASHITALAVLAILTRRLRRNLRFLRRARELPPLTASPPHVSVLVPARNEARTIVSCVESLAAQDYPDFQVIALDDQSSDETGALLDELAARHTNLVVLHGSEDPPSGWNGKSYACFRLAARATGEWLLFTDADTIHMPTSIAQGIAWADSLGVDLLSAFPRQLTGSWSERVVVSFVLDFLPLVGLDLTAVWRGDSGAAANGQYLLVRAAAYRVMGGHKAVSNALVDDFALAKHMRSNGYRIALVDGTSLLNCRMYRGAREVWDGFSKNILLALQTSSAEKRPWWWGLAFAWGYASVFVLPFLFFFSGCRIPSALVIGWLGILRAIVNRRFNRLLIETLTTPLAAWSVMAFGLNAWFRRVRGRRIAWKGRDYSLNH
jgi:chlorobactene glucosyltransferase